MKASAAGGVNFHITASLIHTAIAPAFNNSGRMGLQIFADSAAGWMF